jgi:cytochrome c-type biogenesis protein CcmH/NrfF
MTMVLMVGTGAFGVVPAMGQSQRAKEIGTHLKCLCKGCDMSAGLCAHPGGAFSGPCDTAKSELKEVDDLLAKGQSEQQIIDSFVREYGTIAYIEPPKHGFGLVAWLMPVFYTVIGLAVVVFVVKKWSSHRPAVAAVAAGPHVSPEALERARAQAARETED